MPFTSNGPSGNAKEQVYSMNFEIYQREELAAQIFKRCYLKGEFKLRSGKTSPHYFDKYQFESDPRTLFSIAHFLAPKIPKDTELLGGLEMGGIPVATALGLITGLPLVFIRKEAKAYGTCRFAEGPSIQNKKICLIEDVITT